MGLSSIPEKSTKFFKEVTVEMQKVTWPSLDEVKSATAVVIVATIIVSIYIWGLDQIFGWTYLRANDLWNAIFHSK